MNDDGLQQLLREAKRNLPEHKADFTGTNWPVALLSIAGGWLVSLPVIGLILCVMFLTLQSEHMFPVYLIGIAAVLSGESIARNFNPSLFAQHLGNSTFIVGASLLTVACFIDYSSLAPTLLVLPICFAAFVVSADWLRLPLGAMAACMFAWALQQWLDWKFPTGFALLSGPYGCLAVWLCAQATHKHLLTGLDDADIQKMQAISDGWLLTTWVVFCVFSGSALILTASLPFSLPFQHGKSSAESLPVTSAALSLAALIWLLRHWPSMRNWRGIGTGIAVAELAYFAPMLGPVLIGLAACAVGRRWRMAATACMFAIWIIGGQYYQTDWPLLMKAKIMGSIGSTLLLCAYFPYSASKTPHLLLREDEAPISPAIDTQRLRRLAGLGLLLILVTTSIIVSLKEYAVAHGTQIFFQLGPVDPRSLMQGDYMRLSVDLGNNHEMLAGNSGRVVIRRDKNGIASVARTWKENDMLKDDEYVINLKYEFGRWRFPSDAWYFTEGDANHWVAARFGEYRVDRSGSALLVGLRNEQLKSL